MIKLFHHIDLPYNTMNEGTYTRIDMGFTPILDGTVSFIDAYRRSNIEGAKGKALFALITAGLEGLYSPQELTTAEKEKRIDIAMKSFQMGIALDDVLDVSTHCKDGEIAMDTVAMPYLIAQAEVKIQELINDCPDQTEIIYTYIRDYCYLKQLVLQNQESWTKDEMTMYREVMNSMCIRLGFALFYNNISFMQTMDWPTTQSDNETSSVFPWYSYMVDHGLNTTETLKKYLNQSQYINPFRKEVLKWRQYSKNIEAKDYQAPETIPFSNFERIRKHMEVEQVQSNPLLLRKVHEVYVPSAQPQTKKDAALAVCVNIIMASQVLNDLETDTNEALSIKTMKDQKPPQDEYLLANEKATSYMQKAYRLGFPKTWGIAFYLLGVTGWSWTQNFASLIGKSKGGREIFFERMFLRQKLTQAGLLSLGTETITDAQEFSNEEIELIEEVEAFREHELEDLNQSRNRVMQMLWEEFKDGDGPFEGTASNTAVRGYEIPKNQRIINLLSYMAIGSIGLALDIYRSKKQQT